MSGEATLNTVLAALLATTLILLLLPVFTGLLFVLALLFYPLLVILVILVLISLTIAPLLLQTRMSGSVNSRSSAPYALLKTLLVIVGSALLIITLLYVITYVSSLFPSGGTAANIILLVSEWVAVAIFILFTALSLHRTIREWWKKSSA